MQRSEAAKEDAWTDAEKTSPGFWSNKGCKFNVLEFMRESDADELVVKGAADV
jgi:hypothetical protein